MSDIDYFCDHADPQVQALSKELLAQTAEACSSSSGWEQAYAIAAFNWVRDNISYMVLHNWSVPVSYTLQKRHGNCGTKSCLLVSLLRAVGIEAAFCVEKIDTTATFFFVPTIITSKCNGKSIHFSSAVKLSGGQWLHIDATTDSQLATGMSGVAGDAFQITFDAQSHAVAGGHVGFQQGVQRVDSIAHYMAKSSRVTPEVRECFNLAADYCRRVGVSYKSAHALSQDAEAYIFRNYTEVIAKACLFMSTKQSQTTVTKTLANNAQLSVSEHRRKAFRTTPAYRASPMALASRS